MAVDFLVVSKVLSSLTCSSALSSRYMNSVPNMSSATTCKSNLNRKTTLMLVCFWITQKSDNCARCSVLMAKADWLNYMQWDRCLQNRSEDCVCPSSQSCRCAVAAVCPEHIVHPAYVLQDTCTRIPSWDFPAPKRRGEEKEPIKVTCLEIKKTWSRWASCMEKHQDFWHILSASPV